MNRHGFYTSTIFYDLCDEEAEEALLFRCILVGSTSDMPTSRAKKERTESVLVKKAYTSKYLLSIVEITPRKFPLRGREAVSLKSSVMMKTRWALALNQA